MDTARSVILALVLLACAPFAVAADHPDEGEAKAHCESVKAAQLARAPDQYGNKFGTPANCARVTATPKSYYQCSVTSLNPNGTVRISNATCDPTGGYNQSTGSGLYDRHFFAAACSSRNAQADWINQEGGPRLATTGCAGGCQWVLDEPYTTSTNQRISDGTTHTIYYGKIEWTDTICPNNTPSPEWKDEAKPKEQECVSAGSGQSYCKKKSGENCYTASTGRMICWQPNQTGEKSDGSILQVGKSGNTPPAEPLTPPPPGNSWTNGNTTNVTTTTVNNTTNVVNVTSFGTSGGGPAGGTNSGENNTGQSGNGQSSGGTTGGTGTGDGETESGTASVDCATAPGCSSGDSIGCAMLRQSWLQHCKLKSDLEGSGEPEEHQAVAEGFLAGVIGDVNSDDLFDTAGEGGDIPGMGDVDMGGIGGQGSCPVEFSFSAFGRSYQLNGDGLCQVLNALAMLISMLAIYHSGLILVSGGRR